MRSVDPEFKIAYDLRNDQEANVIAKRTMDGKKRTAGAGDRSVDKDNACPMFGADGVKWMCLAGLAILGLGVGVQLGVDQFGKSRSSA